MADIQRNIKIGKLRAHPIDRIGDNSEQRVEEAKHSGKIILPTSALRKIHRMNQTLMIFKLINEKLGKFVFCGVSAFDGEEQEVSVPLWILKQLEIKSGDFVAVELVITLIQKGLFVKFEPITKSFLSITDPKSVLEYCLRNYVCLTNEDVISIYYNGNIYELRVVETLPSQTIIINECDLTVDFAEMKKSIETPEELREECDLEKIQSNHYNTNSFEAFSGGGQSTGGTIVSAQQNSSAFPQNGNQYIKRGIPDYDWKIGSIFFKRYKKDLTKTETNPIKEQQKKETPRKTNLVYVPTTSQPNTSQTLRRPITRSQTQQMRLEANRMKTNATDSTETQSESIPSNQKRRKKDNQKKNNH